MNYEGLDKRLKLFLFSSFSKLLLDNEHQILNIKSKKYQISNFKKLLS
mgnify:CR=1 FL=1